MDPIFKFSDNIVKTRYDDIPQEAVLATKRQLMDAIAAGIAGSSAESVKELFDIFTDWGGKQESTLWVFGNRLPSVAAAQINATMVHSRDFDDTHDRAVLHPGAVTVPPAFALGESLGNVSGKEIITAVALGVDLTSRLCLACTSDYFAGGWHYTPLHGSLGATAVAGKLLNLDHDKLVHAFGIAYHQAAGNLQCVDDGALTKRCGPGFSVRNGILSALMAKKGITGARNVLTGKRGLYHQYHRGFFNAENLTDALGKRFEGVNVSIKPYPCCRYNHPAIDAALHLMDTHQFLPSAIDSITIHIGQSATGLLAEPPEIKKNPRNAVDTQFSIPWAVAVVFAYGKLSIGNFSDEATKDKKVLSLSNKVNTVTDKDLSVAGIEPCIVTVKTQGGETYTKRVDTPYGSPDNPMSIDNISEKLRNAVPFGVKQLDEAQVEKLIKMVAEFDSVKRMDIIGEMLG
ncbi:MAG: MmgE/PrpD family protein [Desulfobacterales bacterium]|nr:MmgE/PrpD family protein [Desulfobacterales bacterium]